MKSAIFPGTFELFHDGHIHILKKALKIFDFVYVVVANNPDKKSSNIEHRFLSVSNKINELNLQNVSVEICKNKLSDIAKSKNTYFVIRGIRDENDFLYEKSLYYQYKKDYNNYELIYFFSDEEYEKISSRKILNK